LSKNWARKSKCPAEKSHVPKKKKKKAGLVLLPSFVTDVSSRIVSHRRSSCTSAVQFHYSDRWCLYENSRFFQVDAASLAQGSSSVYPFHIQSFQKTRWSDEPFTSASSIRKRLYCAAYKNVASSPRHLPIDTTRLWIRLKFYAHASSASTCSYLMASTTTSSLHFRSILDAALDNYTRLTGIDLTTHPSVHRLQNCHSLDAVLQLLQEREMSFRDYRDGHRRLINWLLPVVEIVHAFSGTLGEVAGGLPVVSAEPPWTQFTF
jgi:hypothetical protein